MDKVIIDGVDVSECEVDHDCYYKQLKRLEQENNSLQAQLNNITVQSNNAITALEQENERLKKQYNCYACDSCGGKEDYINMKRHTENAIKTVRKYSQALQEIKAIAENCINKDACFECKYSDDCYIEDAEIPTYDICKLLLQKITKTEEE